MPVGLSPDNVKRRFECVVGKPLRVASLLLSVPAVLSLVVYTVLVTPKRFFQCLHAPMAFVLRFRGDETSTPLPRFTEGNRAELLVNGSEILPAIMSAIESAERSIRWQVMLFQPDEAGMQIADALAAAAKGGVQVQLAFDIEQTARGTIAAPYSREKAQRFERDLPILLKRLRDAGVIVLNSPPGVDYDLDGVSESAYRMQFDIMRCSCISNNHYDHRKLLIVDDQLAIVGGMNVGNEYLYHVPPELSQDMLLEAVDRQEKGLSESWPKWQDAALSLEGPAVTALVQEFNLRWEVLGGNPISPQGNGRAPGSVRAQVLTQRPGRGEISTSYYTLINGADEEILIASPYVTHDGILEALMEASRRGVRVALVFPGEHNDVGYARRFFRSRIARLLSAGVEVYENNLRMAHSKVVVVDGRWLSVGSFNLDHRSFDHDLELNIVVDDSSLAKDVKSRLFQPYMSQATRLTEPYDLRWRPLDWLIQPFS